LSRTPAFRGVFARQLHDQPRGRDAARFFIATQSIKSRYASAMSRQQPSGVEVAIVGGGPIGLELAAALTHARVSHVQIEAGQIGATFQWWAPQTTFFSSPERIAIAGVPIVSTAQSKSTREDYLAYLRGVVQQFGLAVHSYTRVVGIERRGKEFELVAKRSRHGVGGPQEAGHSRSFAAAEPSRFAARHVVLAIGDMHRPRMLGVPGEDLPHVSHFLADPHEYFQRRVLIVGGKNSAVEAAIRLSRAGASVTMSYRGSEFDARRVKYWLRPELLWLIENGRIRFHPRTIVRRITADHVELAGAGSEDPSGHLAVDADFVLLLTGYEQDPELFEQSGVELSGAERAPRFDPDTMQTSVPGIFVAGTAAAGSQSRARLFIENTHVHVQRIVRAIAGCQVPWNVDDRFSALQES
jgi:thioredoxin reductase (NADPH)